MNAGQKLRHWLLHHRASTRLAFVTQIGVRVASALVNLLWIRLLVAAMGTSLYGVFTTFQSIAALGGLGDLGMGGAVALRAGRMLGQKDEPGLVRFLATARGAFLTFAILGGGLFLVLSPWLPSLLNVFPVEGSGSLQVLFMLGAVGIFFLLLSSYLQNLNYACGNVVWPVLPAFFLLQLMLLAHWLLASRGFPLWAQYLPYLASAVVSLLLHWACVRISHPQLASVRQLIFDAPEIRSLLGKSFWVYLCALGSVVYTTTDRVLVNAAFGPDEVARYVLNYKFCDLAFFVVVSAGFVSMPKITQWISSPQAEERRRATTEIGRLGRVQSFFGAGAALAYLVGNDLFMTVWLGTATHITAPVQIAFACNLAITAGIDAPLQTCIRLSDRGLRVAGATIGSTALLNLALSFLAMKLRWLPGIAWATVLAQLVLGLVAFRFLARQIAFDPVGRFIRGCVVPLICIGIVAWARFGLSPADVSGRIVMWTLLSAAIIVVALANGITPRFVMAELHNVARIFGGRR
jgi:O-antigen/teichoic acid export membrane protein